VYQQPGLQSIQLELLWEDSAGTSSTLHTPTHLIIMLLFLFFIVCCMWCVRIGHATCMWKCLLLRYVNIKTFWTANLISIALPNITQQLWFKTDSKLLRRIFLIRTEPIPKNLLTFRSEPKLWISILQTLNMANVLFVSDMWNVFYIVYLGLNITAI